MVALVALAVGLFHWRLWESQGDERDRVIEDTERRAVQLAGAVASRISATVRNVDFALRQVRRDYGVDDARFGVVSDSLLRAFPERSLLQLSFADADGELTYSNLGLTGKVSIRDREHFKTHLDGGDRLFISKPLLGRVSKAWTIQFSRPLLRDDRFAGVAVMSLAPAYVSEVLATLELTPNDTVALLDSEGVFLARNRDVDKLVGKTLSPAPPFMRPGGAPRGNYRASSIDGGAERFFAWQRVPDTGLVALVGMDGSTVLVPLEERFGRERISTGILSGLLIALGIAVLTLLARLSRRQRDIAVSEARFRSLSGLSSDWYWEQDENYRFTSMDGALRERTGISHTDHIGKTRWELPALNMSQADWAKHKALLDAHLPFHELEMRRPDAGGRMHWVSISGEPVFDGQGAFRGYRGTGRDITERKLAEEALRESEFRNRLFAAAFRQSADSVLAHDLDGIVMIWNEAASRMYGFSAAQAVGKSVRELHLASVSESEWEEVRSRFSSKVPETYETARRTGTGELVKLGVSTAPMFDEHGKHIAKIVSMTDITERKRAEEALRESEERLRAIIDNEPECVAIISTDKRLIEMNRAGLAMIGADSFDQVHGHPVLELVAQEHRAAYAELHRQVIAGGIGTLEYAVVGLNGERRWMDTHAAPLRGANGEITAHLAITRDITERKRAERAREKLEAQLRQAQKMEALGTLAGGIAHDFNNILAAIFGNLALARQDTGPEHPAQQSLAEIAKAGQRARDLVQQILAFSRQQPQERRVISLRDVAQEAVKLLRAAVPTGIGLEASFAPDAPNVLADPTLIQQVLMNLGANAWQAIAGRAGRIDISLAAVVVNGGVIGVELPPGRYARLTVTDTGQGMDAATLERIFDPFFTTKATGQGTGLGLAVVDGIVKRHGGAIAVESEPGKSSAFHLYFPAAAAESVTGAEPTPRAPLAGSGQRILYLDDEEALVLMTGRLLRRLGYEVLGYTLPAEALAAFKADPAGFDLLVTDLNMPGTSGLEVAGECLRLRPGLPVALASGFVTDDLRAQARALGIREVIYKPNTVEDLAAAVHRLLGEDRTGK